MDMIYDDKNDILLVLNPNGNQANGQNTYRGTIKVDFDIHSNPLMMEISEASVVLGTPKKILKQLFRG